MANCAEFFRHPMILNFRALKSNLLSFTCEQYIILRGSPSGYGWFWRDPRIQHLNKKKEKSHGLCLSHKREFSVIFPQTFPSPDKCMV